MLKAGIHPAAVIDSAAKLGEGVKIGPFCVIGPEAEIGAGTELVSHVCIAGRTRIGENCKVFPFASLGHAPQDLKYRGEASQLIIGARCVIREHVTMNTGTEGGGMLTQVGDDCLFMVGAHVAHDCKIGNRVILVNNATLGGHVEIGDFAIIGGLSAVHQFVRIGAHAMIGGMSGVEHDVIPYGSVMGERASLAGLNLVGLKRRGFERDTIHSLRAAYRQLFAGEGTLAARAENVQREFSGIEAVGEILAFVQGAGKRQLCVPKSVGEDAA